MCSACGFPPAPGHWTNAGGQSPTERLRIRFARAALLNELLKSRGLGVHDSGVQPGIQINNGMGQTKICQTLEEIWDQVETYSGAPFDPLSVV